MPITKKDLVEFGFKEDEARKLFKMINDPTEPVDNVLNYAHSIMKEWSMLGYLLESGKPATIPPREHPSFGVEAIRDECYWVDHYWQDIVLLYVNTGETYDRTIYYDVIKDIFGLGSWGDWWEWHERNRKRSCRYGPRRIAGTH